MSQAATTSFSSSSSSNFLSIFTAALETYEKTTKKKLLTHPLAAQLQSCNSPAAILSALQDLVQQLHESCSSDQRLTNWLSPTVNVLFAFSATLGEGVGLVLSPAKTIFAGIGVLLLAAKDVDASQDVLVDLFSRMENFFKRLESYTEISPTPAMTSIITNIMVEVLTILGIATKEMKQRRSKKILKKILGKNDIEDALKRLDTLTQEEARMATAEIWKATRCVNDKVAVLIDDGKEGKAIIQQTASNVEEGMRDQLREKLQTWLSPPDPSTNQNIARKVHHRGTAAWFFQSSIFQEWKSYPSLLWIHGKPGSGKSVLCSGIVEDIMAQRDPGLATMAYFYCDFRDEDKQNCRNLLLSILSQLWDQSDPYCDILARIYLAHDKGKRKPSDEILAKCLTEVLSLTAEGPVYLIVDAVDECPNNSGMPTPREEVLHLLSNLVDLRLPNLHICVTSRPEIDIQTTLEPLTSLRVSLHNQTGQKKDIVDYVTSVVSSDVKMRRWRKEDRKLVIETLSERADGMFRWVYCQLETLRHCLPPSVRGILDTLPETLDETYERVLREINKANREHAHRLLHCLTVAIRPLRVEELAEVLAVDFDAALHGGMPILNPHWRWADQHQAILSTCSSLIAIVDDGDCQVVQFSHFSVKEFLTSDRLARSSEAVSRYHILLESAHTLLTQACLGVLLHLGDNVEEFNTKDIPLAKYAAQYWAVHAQFGKVSSCIRETMEFFFDMDKPHWAAWIRVYNIDEHWHHYSSYGADVAYPLYYAAFCGFYDLVGHLMCKYPEHVNARGGLLVTPLVAALYGKHFHVAELLFQHGAEVDVRGGGYEYHTPLTMACSKGPFDTVRWLIDHGADMHAYTSGGRRFTALHTAAYHGQLQSAQALLGHGADIYSRTNWGEVPLHLAASPFLIHRDHLDIMQLLLDDGTDANTRNDMGSTPLHYLSHWEKQGYKSTKGTVEGAHLLLKHGADIDAEDNEGRTPLRLALTHGHDEVVRFLSQYVATRSD